MNKFLLFLVVFLFVHAAQAGSTVRVESKNNLQATTKLYLDALKSANVPLREKKTFTQKLPGGFSREGEEIIFTNPFYGWHLGECHRGERKDKPMTTRIFKDNNGHVWLEYTQADAWINEFGVIECGNENDMVRRVLTGFADAATE